MPTFAVGRAQLLTGLLGWMFRRKLFGPFPVILDSPMAIEAAKIYASHRELFDEAMTQHISGKPLREDLKTMKLCVTAADSMKLNDQPGGGGPLIGASCLNATRAERDWPEARVKRLQLVARVSTMGELAASVARG